MDTAADCRPIYKTPTKSKSGKLSEWSNQDELDQIEKDPAQRVIQSLLVCLRIASSLCWEAVYNCFLPSFIRFLYLIHVHQSSLSQLLDLSWMAMDIILSSPRPHEENILDSVSRIERLTLVCFEILSDETRVDFNSLNSGNLQKIVELLLMSNLSYWTRPITAHNLETVDFYFGRHMLTMSDIVRILSLRLPEMTMTEEIRTSLLELVRRDGRYIGCNLLHFSCLSDELHLPSIRFIVQLGANPNSRTTVRNIEGIGYGVLHLLANKPESVTRDAAARVLLDLGAHLDMADEDGLTATDYWLRSNNQEKHRLPDWLKEDVLMLKCLCSRVVRRHRVPHDESNTPADLIPFVSLH